MAELTDVYMHHMASMGLFVDGLYLVNMEK